MTGLLIKDWKLLKNQKHFFLVMLGMVVFYAFFLKGAALTFVVTYMALMMGMFTVSTISYDEYNGAAFLFTLPVDKWEYVVEKYVFSLINTIAAMIVSSLLFLILGMLGRNEIDIVELLVSGFGSGIIVTFGMLSLVIPLQLKFGAEKSRIVMIGTVLAIVAIGFVGMKALEFLGVELQDVMSVLDFVSGGMLIALVVAVLVAMMVVSCVISIRIMKKREF